MIIISLLCTPSVSYHAMICLKRKHGTYRKISNFNFINSVNDMEGFMNVVARSWDDPINGRPMYVLWKKFHILQPILNKMSKPVSNVKRNIVKTETDLQNSQMELRNDKMNVSKIKMVKKYTEDLINWQDL